ncbi:MAG TPA: CPXCG motif-containing cysteine-rich protein [Steroidobacteraceae bacterium]|nr:CPXCG motif-containing cysteine-rich protein [Steroidobacteraceae bacterium]
MTRRKATELENLKGRITRLDADSVDRLYGLEPVYEPGADRLAGPAPEEFVAVRCPWCGERLETRVDATAGDGAYIEDCEVCCRPLELSVERADNGALLSVAVRRLD